MWIIAGIAGAIVVAVAVAMIAAWFSYARITEALDKVGQKDTAFRPAASLQWAKTSVRGIVLDKLTYIKFGVRA